MSDASPEEQMQQQKENCIFCKIVAGEIPGKKIFEDEQMLAILDIRPAAKGHALVMTKEHYPIMPLIPAQAFDHLFGTTAALSGAITTGALSQQATTFIANGGVAGQQSPHFLFHIIPREEGDGLTALDIPQRGVNQSDILQLLKQNLYTVMREHLTQSGKLELLQLGSPVGSAQPAEQPLPTESPTPSPISPPAPPHSQTTQHAGSKRLPESQLNKIAAMLEQNPEIRQAVENEPQRLQAILDQNPDLRALFAGVDVTQLSNQLKLLAGKPLAEENQGGGPTSPEELIPARNMALQDVLSFIDSKPKLRTLLLETPEQLPQLIEESDRLRQFFDGSDVTAIVQAYRAKHITPGQGMAAAPIKRACDMTLQELFTFIDAKPRLRKYMVEAPDALAEIIPKNERLRQFFDGSNVTAIVQAYQEHAKETQSVHVTIEPQNPSPPSPPPTKKEDLPDFSDVSIP